VLVVGYLVIRSQLRRAQRSLGDVRSPATRSGGTTVEIGRPHRDEPPVDDRY
jgi:hypothetical protein